jgi:uncharacterized protein (TIGR02217 family)
VTSFHEVRLPLVWARGASGGPERRVEIVSLGSGAERRNAVWAHARRRYEIGGGVHPIALLSELIAFFEARRGPLCEFRFRDLIDDRSAAAGFAPSPLDQRIGTGDGVATAFQLVKAYGAGADAYLRPIRKPEPGSVSVAIAGAPLSADGFSVDSTTGIVTLAVAPPAGAIVSAGFHFDTPVRFASERLEATLEDGRSGRLPSVALVEVAV